MAACLLAAGLLGAVSAKATDYYVKTPGNGGSDANSGFDWANAKATISAAMGLVNGSDNIHVAAGTYNERVTFHGSSNNQLLGGYPAAGSGTRDPWTNTTIIDGNGISGTVVYVPGDFSASRGYSGIVIDGFTIRNGTETGAGAGGIDSYSTGLTIKRCIVESNSNSGYYSGGIYVVGLLYEYSSRVLKIEECIIRNNSGPSAGALMFDAIGYVTLEVRNTLVYGNAATATTGSYSVGGLAIGTGAQSLPAGGTIINCTIANNTSPHPTKAVGGIALNADASSSISLVNDIIWHATLDDLYIWPGGGSLPLSYSDVHDTGDTGTGVIHSNPNFAGAGDYHLTAASGGCLNGGTATGAPAIDLEGTARPQGAGYDMGAYEATITDTTPPGPVTGFTATPGDESVQLSWTNPGDADLAGVQVQRKESGYPTSPSDGVTVYKSSGTSTTDTGLANGTMYYYAAFSYDSSANYGTAATAGATPADNSAPGAVTGFTATPGFLQLELTWSNPADADLAGVKIVRRTGGFPSGMGDGTVVYDGDLETMTDLALDPQETYYYAAFTYDEVPNYSGAAHASASPVGCVVSGRVDYSGGQTGMVVVGIATDPDFANFVGDTSMSWTGAYSVVDLMPGTYYVASVILTAPQTLPDDYRVLITDPWGTYGPYTNPMPVTVNAQTQEVKNIDIALGDGSAANPNPFATAAAPQDFDGDGASDITVVRPSTMEWLGWGSAGDPLPVLVFGAPGDIPVPADYDGDGITDLAVFRPANAVWYIWGSTAGPIEPIQFGAPGDTPIPGDFDGDGLADLAVMRPSTMEWFGWGSTEGPFPVIVFGAPDDIPVPADYDGDGIADLAVFRPSNATWYMWGSTAGPLGPTQFGAPGDEPVPADYDGDGIADLAVFRPPTATWYVWGSSVGPVTPFVFGAPSDMPL
jgi:hypothetical protein